MMWMERYHCDGLRMDATAFIRYQSGEVSDPVIEEGNMVMRMINREIHEKHPNVITIAEDLKGQEFITELEENGGSAMRYSMGVELSYFRWRSAGGLVLDEHCDLDKVAGA